jgi:hypothetical protein
MSSSRYETLAQPNVTWFLMLWKFIVNVLSMLKSGFTGLRCLHFGEEAAVGLPIDDIDRSLEEFTDLDLNYKEIIITPAHNWLC